MACAYCVGLLKERSSRITELHTLLAQTHLEKRAFENQLLVKQGSPPIFKENGVIALEHVPDDVPLMQILKPPFAQAELDWEEEEKESISVDKAFKTFVPPLTEEQKADIAQRYK